MRLMTGNSGALITRSRNGEARHPFRLLCPHRTISTLGFHIFATLKVPPEASHQSRHRSRGARSTTRSSGRSPSDGSPLGSDGFAGSAAGCIRPSAPFLGRVEVVG